MAERLRSGDLEAVLTDGPELRTVRGRGAVVLDAIALTVRDPGWATVPGHRLSRRIIPTEDGVRVADVWRFDLRPGMLVCALDVELEPGTLAVDLRTEVPVSAEVNRAGLVLLHPLELAGRPVTLRGPAGERRDHFAARVAPHQPFRDLHGMAYAPVDGVTAALDFGGTPYETEDHRNWADAGWKSYTPPLAEPVPLRLAAGERRRQHVRIALATRPEGRPSGSDPAPRVLVRPETAGVLPAIGWGAGPRPLGGDPEPPDGAGFLFVEVLATARGRDRLHRAVTQARRLGLPLRVTVAATGSEAAAVTDELARLAPPVSHVCFVDPRTHVSTDALVRVAAKALAGTAVAVGAGTRGYLAELGRSAAGFRAAEFVQLSVSAEVHHDDDERILDTTRALPFLVESARAAAGGLPLVVSPLTLAQRLSVHGPAGDDYAPWDPVVPPDRRSGEALGAAWGVAGVAGLLGAEALGYFSLTPGHGLLDPAGDRTVTASWLGELARQRGRAVLRCDVSAPRRVAALAVDGPTSTVYLANRTAERLDVLVEASGRTERVDLAPYAVRRLSGDPADRPHNEPMSGRS